MLAHELLVEPARRGRLGAIIEQPQLDAPPEQPPRGVGLLLPQQQRLAQIGGEIGEDSRPRHRRADEHRLLRLRRRGGQDQRQQRGVDLHGPKVRCGKIAVKNDA